MDNLKKKFVCFIYGESQMGKTAFVKTIFHIPETDQDL